MSKAFKWILILGGGFVVLVIAALVAIPFFVDIDTYKPEIEKRVAAATGRSFSIGSDLDLSLFPFVGVKFSDLRLGNPPGFKEKEFVTVKNFEARVKLLPLLSRDIQIKRFIMKNPVIVLEKTKDGKANWDFGQQVSDKKKPAAETEKKRPERSSSEFPIEKLNIEEFAITEGSLLYIDHSTGVRKDVQDFNLNLKDVSLDEPVQLEFSAVMDKKPISLKGSFGPVGRQPGKGTMTVDLSMKALEDLAVVLKGQVVDPVGEPKFDMTLQVSDFSPRKLAAALGQKLPVETTDAKVLNRVSLSLAVKGDTKNLTVSNGVLKLDDSNLTFSASAKEFTKPNIAFDISLDQIDLNRYMPTATQGSGNAPNKKPDTKSGRKRAGKSEAPGFSPLRRMVIDGSVKIGRLTINNARATDVQVKLTGKDGIFNLNPLALKLNDGGVNVQGSVNLQKGIPKIDLAVKVAEFSPRKLMADAGQEFPVKTSDPKALSRVALSLQVKGDSESVKISNGKVKLDDSNLTFSAGASEFSKPNIAFDVNLDQIDLDRYMPPKPETPGGAPNQKSEKKPDQKPAEKPKQKPAGAAAKPDYSPLRRMVLDGAVKIGKLKVNNAKLQDVQVKVKGKDGIIALNPLSLKLYQGAFNAKGSLNVQTDTPKTALQWVVESVQAGPLVRDVMNKDIIEGTLQSKASISLSGDDPDTIKKSLNGSGELLFQDGAVVGIDIAGMVRNAKAAFGLAKTSGERPKTDFAELKMPFTLENGLFDTRETSMKSPVLRVFAAGNADLPKETLDFRIEPKLVATIKGQGDSEKRKGIMVPIIVSGTFASPKFRPDLAAIAEQQIKERVLKSDEAKKILEKEELKPLKDPKVQEATKGLLKGILKP